MTLMSLLLQTTRSQPDAVLAVDAGSPTPRIVTRADFWQRVCVLAGQLEQHGVGRGNCVAVWLPNWSDTLVWQFATAARGAHVIGINTRYNVEEVAHVLESARPVVLAIAYYFVGLDLDVRLRLAAQALKAPPPSVAVVCGPDGVQPDAAALRRFDVGAGAWAPVHGGATQQELVLPAGDSSDQLAVAFTTSGSTGKPKLAAHSSGAVAQHALAVVQAGGWAAGDVTLCALPLSGVFAFVPAMAAIASGGACLLIPAFQPEAIVAGMARFGVTHVVAADDVIGRLADAWRAAPCGLPKWRRLLIADFNGRSLELAEWAERQFGLVAGGVYGSSELFALTSLWPALVPPPRRWRGGGRTVSPAIRVRCADPETGAVLAPGESGELQFRGYNVVDAYLGAPALRARQFTHDGWFRSGDLGVMHADGAFEYVCRIGDALRLKGFLVEPAEIESHLAAHAAVQVAKVVGLRLADGATEAVAFVELRPGTEATPDELRAWCARTLARHKVPRAVHIVDALPVTSGVNGIKIKTAQLREWAQERERASRA
jgi:acyl-CoA synthetase (AMP-forming)/AMP-acid ligase II